MSYATLGTSTSPIEITNISQSGFWVLLNDEELFLSFSEFPWFHDVAVGKILHVELPFLKHLYWPELDIAWRLNSYGALHSTLPLITRFYRYSDRPIQLSAIFKSTCCEPV